MDNADGESKDSSDRVPHEKKYPYRITELFPFREDLAPGVI